MSKKLASLALAKQLRSTAPGKAPGKAPGIYDSFDKIDGRHPWQTSVPDGYIGYPVRRLDRGKVMYFNYALAREMGLIPPQHGDELTPTLTRKILDTFSIQIINEYDQQNNVRHPKHLIKEHPHMATRYLQLQHVNKKGKTSGDGRSIWNGAIQHKGVTWDISSRGTGVTCLAPGAVEANRPLKTGGEEFGYGCGLADITELLGSAMLAEIFHLKNVCTERVLAIVDLGKGYGIGVRAAPNLTRPAHLFLYLKQARLEPLKSSTDYLIQRQCANGSWKFSPTAPDRYRRMLTEISLSFARFAAILEREYIFAWLDWDGDNVLADAGIIDYGSIRQFGLRHDQYRYDDVQRYSTSLNEQRGKARFTVQVFAQLVNYVETGRRRPIEDFTNHGSVREFDQEFDARLRTLFLAQVGFDEKQILHLTSRKRAVVEELYSSFSVLERTKTRSGFKNLPDGINRAAVFNMRAGLRELPNLVLQQTPDLQKTDAIPAEDILRIIASSYARKADRKLRGALRKNIDRFQVAYIQALRAATDEGTRPSSRSAFLKALGERSEAQNHAGRVTGNGAEFIIEALLKARRRGLSHAEIQAALDLFISSQTPKAAMSGRKTRPVNANSNVGRLFQEIVNIAFEFQEDI
jgi:hypothetical protein